MNIDLSNTIIFTHSNYDYISRVLNNKNIWEPNVTYYLLGLARGGILIDIGANIGYYSLLTAHKYSHIYAFEPIHYNFKLFEQSIQHNALNNITLIKKCVGNVENGTLELSVLPYNYGACRNRDKTQLFPMPQMDVAERILCEQITLDSFVAENNITKIDMIKIDVEGYEKNVLDGFKRGLTLKIATNICLEFSANMLPIDELAGMLDMLKVAGYRLYDIGLQEYGSIIQSIKYDDITDIDFVTFAQNTPTQTNILARAE
jgi:FkbM family methyltransferase